MRIFIAGATGTLGYPLGRALVGLGHHVTGLTRLPEKQILLKQAGVTPAVADALDAPALEQAVLSASPDCVVHALTAIPPNGPLRAAHMAATNKLRTTGTVNLLNAAIAAGAKRFVGESMVFAYGFGDHGSAMKTEEDALQKQESHTWLQDIVDAIRFLEDHLLAADKQGQIEAIPLRYGLFYCWESSSTQYVLRMLEKRRMPLVSGKEGVLPWIHLDDAVSATIAAIEQGNPGEIYNIVDDEPVSMNGWIRQAVQIMDASEPWTIPYWMLRVLAPYLSVIFSTHLPVANDKARRKLAWSPHYRTTGEGLRVRAL